MRTNELITKDKLSWKFKKILSTSEDRKENKCVYKMLGLGCVRLYLLLQMDMTISSSTFPFIITSSISYLVQDLTLMQPIKHAFFYGNAVKNTSNQ